VNDEMQVLTARMRPETGSLQVQVQPNLPSQKADYREAKADDDAHNLLAILEVEQAKNVLPL